VRPEGEGAMHYFQSCYPEAEREREGKREESRGVDVISSGERGGLKRANRLAGRGSSPARSVRRH